MDEIEKLFNDLPTEDKALADIFQTETTPVVETGSEEVPAKDDEPRKNRRHRRLEQQLAEEREARIRAEALAQGRAEGRPSTDAATDPRLVAMYGENTEAIRLHAELLNDFAAKAKEQALNEFRSSVAEEQAQQKKFESYIDRELESIEDEFDVDITSDSPAARKMRHELKDLVEKLSPKDEDGNLTGYADFKETFEVYQSRREKANAGTDRAKEIAARTMQKPGNTVPAPQAPTPGFRGWMSDYKID